MNTFLALIILQLFLTQPMAHLATTTQPVSSADLVHSLEQMIQQKTKGKVTGVEIQLRDPVRGYFLHPGELLVIVPVHHVSQKHTFSIMNKDLADKKPLNTPVVIPTVKDQNRRLRKYRESLKKRQVLKEANFEQMVQEIKKLLPGFKALLNNESETLTLHIIVEERERLWVSTEMNGATQFKRKIVALKINNLQAYNGESGAIAINRYYRTIEKEEKSNRPF